jgi:2-polyprenyl-3-methyl-5-hydroxy-6-metoxy-1,4-benzoquinol methylase
MHNKHCPICKNTALPKMGSLTNYWFCQNCKLGWIKHIPVTIYDEEYYASGSSLLAKLFTPIEFFFYKVREHYTRLSKKDFWIDVGAGDGNYLLAIHAKKKMGIEISRSGRETMKKKGLLVMNNNEFLKKKNLNADVISFWQVIEHVNKPWDYLKAAEKNLKPGGKIVVAVPNISSLEFRIFGKYWFHLAPLYHIWHFSPRSLQKMLREENFKIDKVDYWVLEHHFVGILQTFINRSTKSQDILHKLVKRRQNLQNLQINQIFWICFWCTLGLPFIILFWIFEVMIGKPGTFVIVASKKNVKINMH